MRNPIDNRVHFSELKQMARSAAHYKLACEEPREMTRAMLIGSLADDVVFHNGRHIRCYPGKTRNGKEWDGYQRDSPPGSLLCIGSELDAARGAAEAVLADPVAMALLDKADFQRVMQWDAYGFPCAAGIPGQRGGFDAIARDGSWIADLKITADAQPEHLMRHAARMHWDAQGAWYLDGAKALALVSSEFYLIAVEATPPHSVTVLKASAQVLEFGRKKLRLWAERLAACEASNVWPGYAQAPVDWSLPEWVVDEEAG